MFLTSCDACGFECGACYVDSTWSFLCDLCRTIQESELSARLAPETYTRTLSADEYVSEKMDAFNETCARMRALLASMTAVTARLNAATARA